MKATRKSAVGQKPHRDLFTELTEGMDALAEERAGKRLMRPRAYAMNKAKMKKTGILGLEIR